MGHGIFPSYGMQYQKTVFCHLSKEEKKAVFFPDKKSKKAFSSYKEEEVDNKSKKGKRK